MHTSENITTQYDKLGMRDDGKLERQRNCHIASDKLKFEKQDISDHHCAEVKRNGYVLIHTAPYRATGVLGCRVCIFQSLSWKCIAGVSLPFVPLPCLWPFIHYLVFPSSFAGVLLNMCLCFLVIFNSEFCKYCKREPNFVLFSPIRCGVWSHARQRNCNATNVSTHGTERGVM